MLSRVPSVNDFAADVRSADQLRTLAKVDSKSATREMARQFEALLVQQMMKAMREATPSSDPMASSTSQMFTSMFDQQLSLLAARNGAVGLSDAILRQVDPSSVSSPGKSRQGALQVFENLIVAPVAAAKSAISEKLAGSADAFLNQLGSAANVAGKALGVAPSVLMAHAALETGWGKRPLTDAAGNDSHNLFGIKATPDWKGRTVDVTTTEYVDGVAQKRVERFRAYDSYADAFNDYAGLIQRRYSRALASGDDAARFASALASGGYATDPAYASKLTRVAARVNQLLGA
ncbi:flagellar assembly peptidoglycan hydrolase FlgJ [Chitinibacteraceae bacterium HSL-7]